MVTISQTKSLETRRIDDGHSRLGGNFQNKTFKSFFLSCVHLYFVIYFREQIVLVLFQLVVFSYSPTVIDFYGKNAVTWNKHLRFSSAMFGFVRLDVRIIGPILRQIGISGSHVVRADQSQRFPILYIGRHFLTSVEKVFINSRHFALERLRRISEFVV